MPSYFYHLKFELYRTPLSYAGIEEKSWDSRDVTIWLPTKHSSIFDRLPSHLRDPSTLPRDRPQKPQTQPREPLSTPPPPSADNSVIDCGALRPTEIHDERNIVILSAAQQRHRTVHLPPPQPSAALTPQIAAKDWRFAQVSVESIDIDGYTSDRDARQDMASTAAATVGPSMGSAGRATKAMYLPLATAKNTNIGWGIVHLYRERDETPELRIPPQEEPQGENSQAHLDCTTICIPAVPSYLAPSDFLGFIGDKWREQISHVRMVMTGRMNRYLVLMKFRDSKKAQFFQQEFDGRVFNHIEPETCTVVFIRAITFDTPLEPSASIPDLSHDPFIPSAMSEYSSLKPFPPPTPELIEIPSCPVCLERMDDTTGLLTILCQHVFHCSCLQKWKGAGCPICRHTSMTNNMAGLYLSPSTTSSTLYDVDKPATQPFGSNASNLCSVCDCTEDLWICLVCGNVGCGRYKGGHAKEHWINTAHTFSLELSTQHVWDYAGDIWVHRLIRNKGDGKLVDLPGRHDMGGGNPSEDVVPRAKLENIGIEYTHLLTSQLESQRLYFEEMLSKAVDKASKASAEAERAAAQASDAQRELGEVRAEQQKMRTEVIPALEKDLARERTRAAKSTELARNLGKSLQEEKKVSEGLMKRIEHVNKEVESLAKLQEALKLENADLKDQNHDLTMFISGQEKLKQMEAEGQLEEGEAQEGSVALPEDKKRRKGKGKAGK
ncbi:Zn-finger in ubiquitin-hydrolase [Nemania sp. NC0429]|nr:Zn-finger in ubiquitin-hydrolase [Nemania sp. NC0429]